MKELAGRKDPGRQKGSAGQKEMASQEGLSRREASVRQSDLASQKEQKGPQKQREQQERGRTAVVPYATIVQQFNAAPPGKLYMLHGSERVFRLSLAAAAQALVTGVPMTVVDGANRFDAYFVAEFARRFTASGTGRRVTPEELLERIYVSRAFTCYQMEALITDRLPAFLTLSRSPVAIIFGLLDTFYDDQAPLFEVRNSLRRIVTVLQRLKREGTSVLLASVTARTVPPERRALQGALQSSMDKVYMIEEERQEQKPLRGCPTGRWPARQ